MWLTTQGKDWNIVSFSLYGLSAHFGNVWQQISQLIYKAEFIALTWGTRFVPGTWRRKTDSVSLWQYN